MRKFLIALVVGVGMLVPLAAPTAADAHPPKPNVRHYQAHDHRYEWNRYHYWHSDYHYHHR